MKPFSVSMGKGAKNMREKKKGADAQRHANSHTRSPRHTTGQITGAEFQTKQIQNIGT